MTDLIPEIDIENAANLEVGDVVCIEGFYFRVRTLMLVLDQPPTVELRSVVYEMKAIPND